MSDKKYIDKQYLLQTLKDFERDILNSKYISSNLNENIQRNIPHIDPETKHWFLDDVDTGIIAEGKNGKNGLNGIPGDKGDKGDRGEKGDDGYPFLIYKEYTNISEFSTNDFPEIGLMFMIKSESETDFPVYRYTGDIENPYSYMTTLSNAENIKGDKGDKGDPGENAVNIILKDLDSNSTTGLHTIILSPSEIDSTLISNGTIVMIYESE